MHSTFTHHTELKRFLEETKSTTKQGYLNRLRILLEYDMRPHLSSLAMPVLFLASDRDHLIPSVEQGRYMAARVPRATLRILEGHGHICLIAPNVDLGEILASWGPLANG
jgi:pimeloyl-ACP methyl ester carboxylesterase